MPPAAPASCAAARSLERFDTGSRASRGSIRRHGRSRASEGGVDRPGGFAGRAARPARRAGVDRGAVDRARPVALIPPPDRFAAGRRCTGWTSLAVLLDATSTATTEFAGATRAGQPRETALRAQAAIATRSTSDHRVDNADRPRTGRQQADRTATGTATAFAALAAGTAATATTTGTGRVDERGESLGSATTTTARAALAALAAGAASARRSPLDHGQPNAHIADVGQPHPDRCEPAFAAEAGRSAGCSSTAAATTTTGMEDQATSSAAATTAERLAAGRARLPGTALGR